MTEQAELPEDILWVFDLDHTLATPDPEADRRSYFFQIHHHVPIPEMVEVFNQAPNKIILTNRHPALQYEIEHRWGCPAICRGYDTEWLVIQTINQNPERLEKFMNDMARWKAWVLNKLADQHDRVIFYEDQLARFQALPMRSNIELRHPDQVTGGREA